MSDTKSLLNRISAFRERLQNTPSLVGADPALPAPDPAAIYQLAKQAATQPHWIGRILKELGTTQVNEAPNPVPIISMARKLLEEARGMVSEQRAITEDLFFVRLIGLSKPNDPEPIVLYHQATVAATEASLRMAQMMPESAEQQARICEGLNALLQGIRDRQSMTVRALELRRRDWGRIERVARLLVDVQARRLVSFGIFAELAEELLDDVKLGVPLRFLSVPADPVPRFVAANSLTTAQVVARMVAHDFEWNAQPIVPVAAALMMNVGMLTIPAEVLGKTGALTASERRLIERHPGNGADLLRELMPELGPIADAIGMHHERLDGTGYPMGRRTEMIPALARLLGVAEMYAGMCSDRPHRPAHDPRSALTDTLMDAEHGKLDRDFAEHLLHLTFHPIGTAVELTDGRCAVVAGIHPNRLNLRATGRPVVAVLTDAEGKHLPKPEVIDLMNAEFGGIVRTLNTAERRKLFGMAYPDLA